ncbi:sigma 54-interacting transcriptional regulator [Sporolactobacillus nakayamae]|uniref:Transcriptional regulator containing PAS, AAA-type ATPase, and DNA-binding Fis domains n=1 Tax=Sporolactobacillus nakayamae TaxID=269670 RepID=A0A1I2UE17_9BACL|nr:sigma 54-interacting transcriptional regulator [Sporolactobacillus nakayamae]SFG75243.1 Transcriptional regulator containing PAS, AAA-type ATPase, and DNA-binding Fis domains [Sporolactobacillus nakayamae]
MERIVIIAPSKEFADTVRSVDQAKKFKLYSPTDHHDFSFKETVPLAKKEEAFGAEVLITRGGQATLLRKLLTIPVVEVKMTVLDILRIVHSLKNQYQKIGLVGVENIICDYRELGMYININIYPVFSYDQDLKVQINQAISDRVQYIVGDGMSVDYAKKMGIPGMKLMPSQTSVIEAIEQAENLVRARRQERTNTEQLRMTLETAQDGILLIDTDEKIVLLNKRAANFLKLDRQQSIGEKINGVGEELSKLIHKKQEFEEEVLEHPPFILSISMRKIMVVEELVGWVLSMQDVTKIQKLEQKIRKKLKLQGFEAKHGINEIIAHSSVMKNLIQKIKYFSQTESTILLLGETGTGKELIAQSIHNNSNRKNNPFVPINCGALSDTLLESELFGYEGGAFTGANRNGKAGIFELAHTGTIFLDEIGEIPLALQSRLLRVIQEREIMRIGGSAIIPIDVRIIAATHRNLISDVKSGKFRADLFYRLNVLTLRIPPLRERQEDLPALIEFLLFKICNHYHFDPIKLPNDMLPKLAAYPWPGNIRELENLLERVTVLFHSDIPKAIVLQEVEEEISKNQSVMQDESNDRTPFSYQTQTLQQIENDVIDLRLQHFNGNKERTAQSLGMSRATLWRKLNDIKNHNKN